MADFDFGVLRNGGDDRVAVLALQLLGLRDRHVQADGEIVGEMRAADGNRAGVGHGAFEENHQVAGVRADVQQAHAQFALVGGEGGFGGGDGFEHSLGDFEAGAVGAGDGALKGAAGAGGDVQVDFEAGADHAHGVEDAGLIVDDELARQQVQDFAIGRTLHGAGALDGGLHVFAGDFAHAAAQVEAAVGVERRRCAGRRRRRRTRRCWREPRARRARWRP